MKEVITEILKMAVNAPSGDNSQPWRFEVSNDEIKVFNVPEKDTSLYNYNQNASLIALGGLVENIKIALSRYGYISSIDLLPEGSGSNLVAVLSLEMSKRFNDPLYSYIQERVSNRKVYKIEVLSVDHKRELLKTGSSLADISIKLVDDREEIEKLANAVSVNERIVLENKQLHSFLFSHITWSEKEDRNKKGFFIKTLELKGPQILTFKLLRHWKILKILNKIGVSVLVSRENAKLYKQSSAFIAIIANDDSSVSFLKSGMLMQKFWLTATKLRLGVQPVTGVLFLHHRIKIGDRELHNKHITLVESAYSKIDSIFGANGKPITMMFRVGYADRASFKCLRREPEIRFLNSI